MKKGEAINIIFKSIQGNHSFNIDAFNVHTIPFGEKAQKLFNLRQTKREVMNFIHPSEMTNQKA